MDYYNRVSNRVTDGTYRSSADRSKPQTEKMSNTFITLMMIIFGIFVGGTLLSLLYYRRTWSTRIYRLDKKRLKNRHVQMEWRFMTGNQPVSSRTYENELRMINREQ